MEFRTALVTAATAVALLGMAAPVSAAPYVQDDPIDCDAQDVNGILPGKTDDFALGANSTVTRTYPAPPPLSLYHATVVCNGTFLGLPIQFGDAAQNVAG